MISLKEATKPTGVGTYKKSWEALYKGKWYPVTGMDDIGPYNVYVLDGVKTPVPQMQIKDLRWAEGVKVPKTLFDFKKKTVAKYKLVSSLSQFIANLEDEVAGLEETLKDVNSCLDKAEDPELTKTLVEDIKHIEKELKAAKSRLSDAERMTPSEYMRSGD